MPITPLPAFGSLRNRLILLNKLTPTRRNQLRDFWVILEVFEGFVTQTIIQHFG